MLGPLRLAWPWLFQIHMFTRGCHGDCSLHHLSVVETEALRDPESGRQVRAWKAPGVPELTVPGSPGLASRGRVLRHRHPGGLVTPRGVSGVEEVGLDTGASQSHPVPAEGLITEEQPWGPGWLRGASGSCKTGWGCPQ